MSVREAFKALIMRDYDTTNITLIRQSRKQLVRIIVRLMEKNNKNKSTGQTTIRQEAPLWRICEKQIYGPNNNQARGTTMKNLWKRRWQEKTVSLRPWWRSVWPAFTSCVDFWKYVEPKAKVGTFGEELGVSAFLFFLHYSCAACGYFLPGMLLVNSWK